MGKDKIFSIFYSSLRRFLVAAHRFGITTHDYSRGYLNSTSAVDNFGTQIAFKNRIVNDTESTSHVTVAMANTEVVGDDRIVIMTTIAYLSQKAGTLIGSGDATARKCTFGLEKLNIVIV